MKRIVLILDVICYCSMPSFGMWANIPLDDRGFQTSDLLDSHGRWLVELDLLLSTRRTA